MIDAQMVGAWKEWGATFIAATGTLGKILCDVTPAAVAAAVTGETSLPGETQVRQRVRTGGQRIIDGVVSSTDGSARSMLFYIGTQMTKQADMGGTSTITGSNTFNRASGSFIADGWKVGDGVMPFDMATAANNGVLGIVTTVTSTTLVVNGTPYTNETMPAGSRIFRVELRTRKGIPINSGNTDSAPPVPVLGGSQDPSQLPPPDTGISLGPDGALIAAMVAAVSALPAQVSVTGHSALY